MTGLAALVTLIVLGAAAGLVSPWFGVGFAVVLLYAALVSARVPNGDQEDNETGGERDAEQGETVTDVTLGERDRA